MNIDHQESLEAEVERLRERATELERERDDLHEHIERIEGALDQAHADYDATKDERDEWRRQERLAVHDAAKLETALRFYADEENYKEQATGAPNTFGLYESTECPIWDDHGETARAALGETAPKERAYRQQAEDARKGIEASPRWLKDTAVPPRDPGETAP